MPTESNKTRRNLLKALGLLVGIVSFLVLAGLVLLVVSLPGPSQIGKQVFATKLTTLPAESSPSSNGSSTPTETEIEPTQGQGFSTALWRAGAPTRKFVPC